MKAIEFNTVIQQGLIQIPKMYQNLTDTNARVIVMFEESNIEVAFNKESFIKSLNVARNLGLFKEITESVDWQKKLRDEWE